MKSYLVVYSELKIGVWTHFFVPKNENSKTLIPSVSTTVTKTTWMFRGRSFEVIQEEISAVEYFNIDGPTAAVWAPAEADLFGDFAFFYWRMSTVKPTRGMGTTFGRSNAWRRHFSPRITLETIPSIQWSITKRWRWAVGHFPVTVGQILVVGEIWNFLWANTLAFNYFDCHLSIKNKTNNSV